MELNEELDWDLHAIVRAFTSSSSTATATATTTSVAAADHVPRRLCFSSVDPCSVSKSEKKREREGFVGRFEDPFGRIGESSAGLEDLCNPFCSDFDSLDPSSRTSCSVSGVSLHNHNHKGKKRKNVMKKVCYVPAEELSDDVWAWRKYGQKPIKGSPYPRGYYRCSSSKGCSARKQVERNSSDPKMFTVTYTAEHNHPAPTHRNSLAGSARQKTNTSQSQKSASDTLAESGSPISTTAPQVQYSCSSPTTSRSPTTDSKTDYGDFIKDEYDNKTEASRMILDDDHPFLGFEDLDSFDIVEDCFLDQFPASMEFPWLVNNSSSTAAGGG